MVGLSIGTFRDILGGVYEGRMPLVQAWHTLGIIDWWLVVVGCLGSARLIGDLSGWAVLTIIILGQWS